MQARTWVISIVVILLIGLGVYAWFNWDFVKGVFTTKEEEPAPTVPQEPVVKTYASSTMGISFDYPPNFILNDTYTYEEFEGKPIFGVAVSVPQAMATGTNLSADSYVSVEQLPRAKSCSGDIYLTANVRAIDIMEDGVEYSVASSSEAAAGNRYDEVVYALKDSVPCTAVRYFIHSTAIGNYEPGAVVEFDQTALLREFDKVRRTLLISL